MITNYLPFTSLGIQDICSIVGIPLSGPTIEQIFTTNKLNGNCLNSTYCPPISGPTYESDKKLLNLQTLPYDISKFRGYGYKIYQNVDFLKLQPIHYVHIPGEVTGAIYNDYYPAINFPYEFDFVRSGRFSSGAITPNMGAFNSAYLEDYFIFEIPAQGLLNINYNLKASQSFTYPTSQQYFRITDFDTGTELLYKNLGTSTVHGSDIDRVPTIARWRNSFGNQFWHDDFTGLYAGEQYEVSNDFPFYYHNTSASTKKIALYCRGYSFKIGSVYGKDERSIFFRPILNHDSFGNLFGCSIGTSYSYWSSFVFLYNSPSAGSYSLTVVGGNNVNSGIPGAQSGLSFKLGYSINNVFTGYLNLYYNGTPSQLWRHNSNITVTYTFTVPTNCTALYLMFAASRQHQISYTGCDYSFIINNT